MPLEVNKICPAEWKHLAFGLSELLRMQRTQLLASSVSYIRSCVYRFDEINNGLLAATEATSQADPIRAVSHYALVNSSCARPLPRATAGHMCALSVPGVGHLPSYFVPTPGNLPSKTKNANTRGLLPEGEDGHTWNCLMPGAIPYVRHHETCVPKQLYVVSCAQIQEA